MIRSNRVALEKSCRRRSRLLQQHFRRHRLGDNPSTAAVAAATSSSLSFSSSSNCIFHGGRTTGAILTSSNKEESYQNQVLRTSLPSSFAAASLFSTTTSSVEGGHQDEHGIVVLSSTDASDEEEVVDEKEMERITRQLLDAPSGSWDAFNIEQAERTIRYWTTLRTPEAVVSSFLLLERIRDELSAEPDLLQEQILQHWNVGEYPRATHLLNAVLDSWRIVWEKNVGRQRRRRRGSSGTDSGAAVVPSFPPPPVVLDRLLMWNDPDPNSGVTFLPANTRSFSTVMTAIRNCWDYNDSPILCESILNRMLEIPNALPDTVAVTTALSAWAGHRERRQRPDASQRTQQLFLDLLLLYEQGVIPEAAPNTITYNTLLDVLCHSRRRDDMEAADDLLQNMLLSALPDVTPNGVTYRLIMQGWLDVGVTTKAMELLKLMVQRYRDGSDTDGILDATFFSIIISKLVKSIPSKNSRRKSPSKNNHNKYRNLDQAEQVYHMLLDLLHESGGDARFQPEVYTTRAMLVLYAKNGQPEEAEMMLQKLEKQAAAQNDPRLLPRRGHYRDVLLAWTDVAAAAAGGATKKKKNNRNGGTSSSKDNSTDPAERAERVLLRMIDISSERRERQFADKFLIDKVLSSWSSSSHSQAPERAQSLLFSLLNAKMNKNDYQCSSPHLQLGRSSFQRVLLAWARSSREDSGARAELLLRKLQERYASGVDSSMRPHRQAYTAVITAYAWQRNNSTDNGMNACESIERLVQEAWVEGYEKNNREAQPDTKLYSAAIHGFAKRGDGEGAERILSHMLKDYTRQQNQHKETVEEDNNANSSGLFLKPGAEEFNLVLIAWLRSSNQKIALTRARNVFNLMQQKFKIRPNRRSCELMEEIEARSSSQT